MTCKFNSTSASSAGVYLLQQLTDFEKLSHCVKIVEGFEHGVIIIVVLVIAIVQHHSKQKNILLFYTSIVANI